VNSASVLAFLKSCQLNTFYLISVDHHLLIFMLMSSTSVVCMLSFIMPC
jgi:hypothetical protein